VGFAGKVVRNERVYARVAAHDIPAMNAGLQAIGIQPLVNAAARLKSAGVDLWVAGVDDLSQGTPDLDEALRDVPAGAPLLLLAHNPDIWLEKQVTRADLVLAGHTHGGQVRLPGLGSIHTQGTHLSRRKAAGWFERGGTRMFVTRGVGESLPLRLGVLPQAALIRLVGTDQRSGGIYYNPSLPRK
jgi:predicted MPP superfamily phosphohydrolase